MNTFPLDRKSKNSQFFVFLQKSSNDLAYLSEIIAFLLKIIPTFNKFIARIKVYDLSQNTVDAKYNIFCVFSKINILWKMLRILKMNQFPHHQNSKHMVLSRGIYSRRLERLSNNVDNARLLHYLQKRIATKEELHI